MVQSTTTTLMVLLALSIAVPSEQRVMRSVQQRTSSINIEAESLVGSAQVSQGTVAAQDMRPFGPGWGGDAQLFWGGAQIGAGLRLSFTTTVTGRYEIYLHFTRAPDYAFVQASFDGGPPTSFNGYAATVSRDRALLGMLDLTPGVHEIILKVTMKDGPSKGLNVGLDRIELAPVSGPSAGSPNRTGVPGQIGAITGAVEASMAGGGAARVPVLRLGSDADTQPGAARGVEPLPLSARLSIAQRVTSLPLRTAGESVRLTATNTRVLGRADITLTNGSVLTEKTSDGFIAINPGSALSMSFFGVEPGHPQLLDCGVSLSKPTEIRIAEYLKVDKNQNFTGPDLSKVTLPEGHSTCSRS